MNQKIIMKIVGIIALLVVGGATAFVVLKPRATTPQNVNQVRNQNTNSAKVEISPDSPTWVDYKDTINGITFRHPENWQVIKGEITDTFLDGYKTPYTNYFVERSDSVFKDGPNIDRIVNSCGFTFFKSPTSESLKKWVEASDLYEDPETGSEGDYIAETTEYQAGSTPGLLVFAYGPNATRTYSRFFQTQRQVVRAQYYLLVDVNNREAHEKYNATCSDIIVTAKPL